MRLPHAAGRGVAQLGLHHTAGLAGAGLELRIEDLVDLAFHTDGHAGGPFRGNDDGGDSADGSRDILAQVARVEAEAILLPLRGRFIPDGGKLFGAHGQRPIRIAGV